MAGDFFDRFVEGEATAPVFSDGAVVGAMLRFEIALGRAQAAVGLIPVETAERLATALAQVTIDEAALARDGAQAGSVAIPFVKSLTAQVTAVDAEAARWIHFGATSQDVIDTAMASCAKDALRDLDRALLAAIHAAAQLADRTLAVPTLARTLLQPAGVTTVGYRAAQWGVALKRCRRRLRTAAETGLAVSLGGAIGDLAQLDREGEGVRAELARRMGLADPGGSWHTLRDDWIALHVCLGTLAGTMRKIAADIARAVQPEVGELGEPDEPGRGGSTAMPHKRNPVLCLRILAATQPIPGWIASLLAGADHEFERALGAWQSELATIPRLWSRTVCAAEALASLLKGLQVDEARCRANIEATRGMIFADRLTALWTPALGRSEALAAVEALCHRSRTEDASLLALAETEAARRPALQAIPRENLTRCFDAGVAAGAATRQGWHLLQALEGEDGIRA